MSTLTITRPPQFLDPWFAEIEQVWDELEAATNDQETRIGNLEIAIVSDVVTSLSAQGEPALTGPVVLDKGDDITLTQVGNTITIGGGTLDHGNLTPATLLDDDHTIYLLADGTRSLTGNMSHGLTQALNFRVEGFAVPPAAGNQGRLIFNQTTGRLMIDDGSAFIDSGVTVHADLTGLGADDHTQYARTDGTRDITGDQTYLQDIIVTGQYQAPATETWEAYSQEDDGGSALAFLMDTANLMDTAGSQVLAVRNAGNEFFAILRDSDPSPLGTFSDEHVIKLTEKTGSDVGYLAMTTDPALVLLGVDGVAVNAISVDASGDYLGAVQLDGDGPTHAALLAQDLDGSGSPKAEVSAEDTIGGGEKAEFTASLAAGVDPLGRVRATNGAVTAYADHVSQLDGINPEAWVKSTSGSETAKTEASFDGSTVPFVELEVAATAGTDKLLIKNAEFDFQVDSNSELQIRAGEVEVFGTLIGGSSPFLIESKETDGASAIAFTLDTQNAIANDDAKLLSLQTNSVEKAYIGEDGKAWLPGIVLGRQTGDPISNTEGEGLYVDNNGDLQYHGPNDNLVQITDGDDLVSSLTSDTSLSAFIDRDDDSTTETFTIYHNTLTPNPGDELLQVRENGEVEIYGGPLIGGSSTFELRSKEADGASAVGFTLNTQNNLANAAAKILSLQNNSSEKAYFGEDGKAWVPAVVLDRQSSDPIGAAEGEGIYSDSSGDLYYHGPNDNTVQITDGDIMAGSFVTIVQPGSSASSEILAAINAAGTAGGGIVQLLAGTYEIDSVMNVAVGTSNVTLQGVGDATVLEHDGVITGNLLQFTSLTIANNISINNVTKGDTSIYATTPAQAGSVQTGDIIFLKGTDSGTEIDAEAHEAAANGNGTTGEIQLKRNVQRTMTSVTTQIYRGGEGIKIRDLKFTTSGAVAGTAAIELDQTKDAVIENITIQDWMLAQTSDMITMGSHGINNSLQGCKFIGCNDDCILTSDQIDMKVKDCLFQDVAQSKSIGIAALNLSGICVDTEIIRNEFKTVGGIGVKIFAANQRRTAISANQFYDIWETGIYAEKEAVIANNYMESLGAASGTQGAITVNGNGNDVVIQGNHIKDFNLGILVGALASSIVVDGNVLRTGTDTGISCDGTFCTVTGNTVQGAYFGMLVARVGNVVSGNICRSSGLDGILVSGTADTCVISNNVCQSNGDNGIELQASSVDCIVSGNNCNGDGITNNGTGNNLANNME